MTNEELQQQYNAVLASHPDWIVDTFEHLPFMRSIAKGNVMEIGVDVGHTTTALLLGVSENGGNLYSTDVRNVPCANVCRGHKQWTFIHADSKHPGSVLGQIPASLDVLYVDGDHSYEGALADLNNYGPLVVSGGVILAHDILHHDFPGVRRAWKEYCSSFDGRFEVHEGSWGLGVAYVI